MLSKRVVAMWNSITTRPLSLCSHVGECTTPEPGRTDYNIPKECVLAHHHHPPAAANPQNATNTPVGGYKSLTTTLASRSGIEAIRAQMRTLRYRHGVRRPVNSTVTPRPWMEHLVWCGTNSTAKNLLHNQSLQQSSDHI
jgi:hypothetical protein